MTAADAQAEPTAADHTRGRVFLVSEVARYVAVFFLIPLNLWPPHSYPVALAWVVAALLVAMLWEPRLAARWRTEVRDSTARTALAAGWRTALAATIIALVVL